MDHYMTRLLHLGAIAAVVAALLALSGCGGGSSSGTNPSGGDNGSLSGKVVHGDAVNTALPGATVTVTNATGEVVATGTTDGLGNFLLPSVPVGQVTVLIETPNEASYGSQSVPGVTITRDTRTTLTIPVLRVTDSAPTQITLAPSSATIDLRGQVAFSAAVASGASALAVTPVFLAPASIGVIDRNGVFTATQVGSGTITAICGDITATATVTVTGSRPPQITSFLVSPVQFKATGGWVYVTAAANDGDGIASVKAQIYNPDASVTTRDLTFNEASTDTYQLYTALPAGSHLGYHIPANSNEPDANGVQAVQRYSIRVVVTDNAGQSTTTDFVDVTVAGLDAPPPPQ